MIVGPHPDGHMVFRQMAHGAMAAEMADLWGNEDFGELDSRQAIREAELLHDTGWDPLDDVPQLNPRTRLPVVFRDAARSDSLAAQREGVRACMRSSPYTALLALLHFTSTYRRPALVGALRPDARRLRAFLAESMRLQSELRSQVDVPDAEIERSGRLTRAIDGTSIGLLSGRPPEVRRAVPAADGRTVDIEVAPLGDRRFSLDPWPFAPDRVALDVPGRLLTRRYDDEAEMRAALDEAPEIIDHYELRPR